MAVYEIKSPDGQSWEVNAPDNATESEVMSYAQSQWKMTTPIKKQKAALGDGQGLLRQFAKSASFGFDDELAGAVSAVTGGDYGSARDAYNRESQQYEDANPVKSFAAGLTGSLATGIGGAGKLAATKAGKSAVDAYKGATALGRFGMNVGAGAATGALSGAGNAEDGRLAGAAGGALIGGATGGLVQPVAYGARKAVESVAPMARWAADRVTMGPEKQFARKLAEAMQRDGMSPEDVGKALTKLGPNSMLADVGENVRGIAEGYALQPGAAKRAANSALMKRAKGQAGRATKAVLDGLDVGADDLNFDKQIAGIHQTMRDVGKGYAPLVDSVETPMNDKIERLMKGPMMKSALAKARSIAENDVALGEADDTILKQLAGIEVTPAKTDALGMLTEGPGMNLSYQSKPTLRVWDYAKRSLDSTINDGTDPITGKLTSEARQALVFKNKLLSEIDAVSPEYKDVRGKYADQFSLESAMKLGRAFFGKDSEVTARFLDDMSDPEKAMFRAGAARAIRDKILSAPDTGDSYKRVFGNQLTREKVRSIFPDAKSYTKFAREMQREATFGQTKNAVLGNSRTAAREALKDDAGVDPGIVADIARGNVGGLAARLAGKGVQSALEVPEATRNVAAQYLFSTDPAAKAKALGMLAPEYLRLTKQAPQASPFIPLGAGILGGMAGQ